MTLQLKKMHESSPYRSILLKGEPTAGKSWLSAHLPNPVFVDFDKNQARLSKLPSKIKENILELDPIVDNETGKPLRGRLVWDNFLSLINKLKELKDHTIIIDSATSAEPYILMKMASSEKPDIYGDLSFSNGRYQVLATYWEQFFDVLTKDSSFKNHVVLIAHETYKEVPSDINNPKSDKRPVWIPSFTGSKTSSSVEKYFTDVWRCYVDNSVKGNPRYMVTTKPTQSYKALSSLDLPETFEASSQVSNIAKQLSFEPITEQTEGGDKKND